MRKVAPCLVALVTGLTMSTAAFAKSTKHVDGARSPKASATQKLSPKKKMANTEAPKKASKRSRKEAI